MNQPTISVIIPTYNRRDSLLRTLESLGHQTFAADRFEVIVADDGGKDGTAEALRGAAYPFELRYFQQPHLGVGVARNLGLDNAKGELLLYLDDDMIVEPEVLAEHCAAHKSHPNAVVKGQVILVLNDPDSVYATIQSGTPDLPPSCNGRLQPISYQQIFAGHFSIRREDALAAGKWEAEPLGYGFQDLEFMYRCKKAGLAMLYAPRAVSHHLDHATSFATVCRRLENASRNATLYLFVQHPELKNEIPMFRDKGPIAWRGDPIALILRKIARQIASSGPVMRTMRLGVAQLERRRPSSKLLRLLYRWIGSGNIYRGYRAGLQELAAESTRPASRPGTQP